MVNATENDYGDSVGHHSVGLGRGVTAIDEMVNARLN